MRHVPPCRPGSGTDPLTDLPIGQEEGREAEGEAARHDRSLPVQAEWGRQEIDPIGHEGLDRPSGGAGGALLPGRGRSLLSRAEVGDREEKNEEERPRP